MTELGFGLTLSMATSGFTASARITTITDTIERASYDATALNTTLPSSTGQYGGREYTPASLSDPGTLELVILYNQTAQIPINAEAETITLTMPTRTGVTTPASISGQGFITSASMPITTEDLIRRTISIKKTGIWTETAGS